MPVSSEVSVQKEYDKNPNMKPEHIQNLRDWLNEQPHLPHEFITDFDIVMANHSCEYRIEQTKCVIDLNYTLRTLFTFYQNRVIDKSLEVALQTWLVTPLTTPTTKGNRAIYCQLLDPDPKIFVYSDVIRAFVMIMDLWQWQEGSVPGVAVIVNMDRVCPGHLSRIDLKVAQQFFYFLQEAMFVHLREFHFINAPSFVDTLMNMLRPLTKKDMLDLIKVHPAGSNTLNEFIPKAALPSDAGGENKDSFTLRDEMWNKLRENETFFEEESKKRVDESKRPGGPKTISSFFSGLEASFKKLEID